MGVNNLGMGILLEAKDLASGVLGGFASKLLEVVGGTSEAGKKVKASMQELGTGFAIFAAGAKGLALLDPATKAASVYSNGIAEITTLTDEASLGFDHVYDSVLNMNSAFGGGTAQQTKALYDGISAGASNAAEATDLLTASNKLAVAGKTEVGVALDGLTSSMNAYGVSFSRAADFSDALFVAVQKGKTTIPELSSVIGRVAPTASALGISFEEVNAALAAVTAKGLKTEEAATGIKAALANIINPAGDAAAEASRLGIKFTAAEVRSKGFAGLLREITGSARFNKDSLSKLFTSVEGLNAVLALTANGSVKFEEALTAMGGKAGAADKAFGIMSGQLAFSEKRFEAVKENALILIGDALLPMKQMLVGAATAIVDAFNRIPTPIKNFLVQAFAASSAVLAVVGAVMAAKAAFSLAGVALSALGITAGGVLSALLPIVGVISVVALGFAALKSAYDANLGGFADRVNSAVASVKLAFSALGQLFASGEFSGAVMEEVDKAENSGIKNFAIRVYVWANRIQEFFAGIGRGFSAAMAAAKPSFDAFSAALTGLMGSFGGLTSQMDSGAGAAFDAAGAKGAVLGQALGKLAVLLVDVATQGVKLATALKPLVSGVASVVASLGGLDTILYAVKIALVAMTAKALVSAEAAIVQLGVSALASAGSIGGLSGALAILRGISITSAMAGAATGIRTLITSSAAALGPIGALTAAITALYAAWDQLSKLSDEWDENSWDQITRQLWADLGVDSTDTRNRQMGLVTGDDYDRMQEERAKGVSDVKAQRDALLALRGVKPSGPPGGVPSPAEDLYASVDALAAGQRQQATAAAVAAAAATGGAGASAKPPVVNASTTVLVQVNGEDIPSTTTTRTQVGAGVPTAPAGV